MAALALLCGAGCPPRAPHQHLTHRSRCQGRFAAVALVIKGSVQPLLRVAHRAPQAAGACSHKELETLPQSQRRSGDLGEWG